MPPTRYLIVNADDFGQSLGVNQGIITAHEHGIVTSSSLMVRWPAAAAAAAYGRAHPGLSLGLHIDLGEWAYRDDSWAAVYEVVPTDEAAAVAAEVARQLAVFRELVGQDPSHIDCHQHVHRGEPTHSIVRGTARALGVPLRQYNPTIRYCGDFYGQTGKGAPLPDRISAAWLVGILANLLPGLTELGCHPGLGDEIDSMYRSERAVEVHSLCSPLVRAAIDAEGIVLRSFHAIAEVVPCTFTSNGVAQPRED